MVTTGFQGDIGGGAARLVASLAQGVYFGMRLAGTGVPAFTDYAPVADDDAADAGIVWVE